MEDDFENDSENDDTDDTGSDESNDSDNAGSDDSGSESSPEAKRISALQSKADKAEARANKAEKALKAAESKGSSARVDSKDTEDIPPAVQEWLIAAEDRLRESLFEEDPRFKEFDVDPKLISGATPAEMRESQKALIKFVDGLEGKVRDSVLIEHGFEPEPKSGNRQPIENYATMTLEEFQKHEKRALEGGMLRRS